MIRAGIITALLLGLHGLVLMLGGCTRLQVILAEDTRPFPIPFNTEANR